jgi:outer membrane protein assembly factor BamE (lipoprotein component of BamABCDE complex)
MNIRTVSVSAMMAFACLMVGCASVGNETLRAESESSVKGKVVEGKTTKSEVKSMFGSPLKTSFTDGGLEIWTYEFSKVSADAVSYIPIVNLFGATASGTKKELVVMFNKDSVVQRYSMSESDVKQKTGVFNQ